MSGRAVASTMPPGAWAGTAATGRGPRGEATVGSAVARPLEVAGGRSFQSPPPCRGLRSRRGRRRVTLAASLLFALILVADLETTSGNYGSFGFGKPCAPGMVPVQKPEGTKCFPDPARRSSSSSSSSWQQISNGNLIGSGKPSLGFDKPYIENAGCARGKVPVRKPEGIVCLPDRGGSSSWQLNGNGNGVGRGVGHSWSSWESVAPPSESLVFTDHRSNPPHTTPENRRHRLPGPRQRISFRDERCLSSERVFWPEDEECHTLLTKGPCPTDGDWLVVRERPRGGLEVVCEARPCPCTTKEPQLCEVSFPVKDDCNPCRVALAAEQGGICGHGEQLRLTPFGKGICDCRDGHVRWLEDEKCHELHTRGPCGEDETFVYSPPEERPFCIYTLCKHPEMALHDDGRCYFLGERGPCGEAEELRLDERTKMPLCQPVVKVKRIFDMAPNHLRRESQINNILGGLKARSGLTASAADALSETPNNGGKRGTIGSLLRPSTAEENRVSMTARAEKYLRWLRSFSGRTEFGRFSSRLFL